MKKDIRVLFVEDVASDAVLVNHELRKAGLSFRTKRVDTREDFLRELKQNPPDLILSDHGLPSFDGFAALQLAREECPEVPFIFVTNCRGDETAIETFERGATDYVLKNNLSKLGAVVHRALRETEERAKLRRKEEALRESEERFRLLVEGVRDYAIYMLDPQGRVATWNEGAQRIEGYAADEIIGKPFSIFFPPELVQIGEPERILKKAAREGRVVGEGWRVRKGGELFWSEGTITALRDEKGNPRGFSKIAHDITRHKKAEDEIRQLNLKLEQRVAQRTAQLEAANRELEAFSYSVSHDLRAPLRHIVGYVDILQNEAGAKLDKSARQHLQTIARSARQMDKLIEGLLAFSRAGRAEMKRERVHLNALIEEARHDLRRDIEGRDIEWRIAKLPAVQGDLLMLRQVIVNLLSNALKYTRPRSMAKIEIGATAGEGEMIFFVRDNGVGFDMKYAEKLFGVFQRLHRPGDFEGTGIGLANVRRIIRRHGGRTWAEGAVNRGATFYFSIPTKPESHEQPQMDIAG